MKIGYLRQNRLAEIIVSEGRTCSHPVGNCKSFLGLRRYSEQDCWIFVKNLDFQCELMLALVDT